VVCPPVSGRAGPEEQTGGFDDACSISGLKLKGFSQIYVLEKRNLRVSGADYGAKTMTCAFKLPDLARPNHPSLSKEGNFDKY